MKTIKDLENDLHKAGYCLYNDEHGDSDPWWIMIQEEEDFFDSGCEVFEVDYLYPSDSIQGDGDFGMKLLQPGEAGYVVGEENINYVAVADQCIELTKILLAAGWHVLPYMLHEEVSDTIEGLFVMEKLPEDTDYPADKSLLEKLQKQKALAQANLG